MFPRVMILTVSFCLTISMLNAQQKQEFYEIKVYHFNTTEQENILDTYYEKAFIPAAHKAGLKYIGVFKPLSNDTAADKRLYVILPFASTDQMINLTPQMEKSREYIRAGNDYINAPYTAPPYIRYESILLKAFTAAPVMQLPKLGSPKAEHVYELRSYEGHTEKIYQNKVHMFNEGGEVPLFKRLNFNAVFYGGVIAGSRMPNLMYMTSFENMKDRDTHWDTFRNDPEWKALSARPEYQKNVSKSDIILMTATPYSDY
ncbi:NIPSNAP family containing protein [Terrimonas sp.]|uniref:NIPSNAP family protein n=1 Tax=Terrimonas sp. TaxID=1914338 RepID=UPI000D508AA5|nr:NIPSNAP family protein [Terrimonas sp.]PVD50229.1 NIPSNAP family containing protein [Terrimonas sp.]